jgi:hypothetical protein
MIHKQRAGVRPPEKPVTNILPHATKHLKLHRTVVV